MTAAFETDRLEWQGIVIDVRYRPRWSPVFERIYGVPVAHLEIRAVDPPGRPLPLSETGYRSHFIAPHEIDACGGPAGYARAWLDEAALDPAWIEAEAARRQLTLFE